MLIIIMIAMKSVVRAIIRFIRKISEWAGEEERTIYLSEEQAPGATGAQLHSIWDYLIFNENTQAAHLQKVVGFEEWVDMGEIMRRIREVFGVDYKNERSLYPYIKTLVDSGLFEATNTGGRRRWRKKDLVIRVAQEHKAESAEHPGRETGMLRERRRKQNA